MGCGSSLEDLPYNAEHVTVTVFGATGSIGGPIARTLLRDSRFRVKVATRKPTSDQAHTLAEEGAIIVTCDMKDPNTLGRAVNDTHVVFLTTHYWDNQCIEKEVKQGMNVIDAAEKAKVPHLIFNGSDPIEEITGKECAFLDSKAKIEAYLKEKDMKYTVIHLPFFYENFLATFKPHKMQDGTHSIALPMGHTHLNMICAEEIGRCVQKIIMKPKNFLSKTLPLAGDRLTVQQICDVLTKHLEDKRLRFVDPKIRIKDYERFTFAGAKVLAAMFQYYQMTGTTWDVRMTKKLNPNMPSLERWVHEHREELDKLV